LLIAGSVHVVKSVAVRPAVTAVSGGAGNIPVSIAEDFLATIVSILAIIIPVVVAVFVVVSFAVVLWWWWRRTEKQEQSARSEVPVREP
jgi:nitrate/nitrite transporter NarK